MLNALNSGAALVDTEKLTDSESQPFITYNHNFSELLQSISGRVSTALNEELFDEYDRSCGTEVNLSEAYMKDSGTLREFILQLVRSSQSPGVTGTIFI